MTPTATALPSTQAAARIAIRSVLALAGRGGTQENRDRRGQREHRGGVAARIGQDAQVGTVNRGLSRPSFSPTAAGTAAAASTARFSRPVSRQADDHGGAQRHGRKQRTREGKPSGQALTAASQVMIGESMA